MRKTKQEGLFLLISAEYAIRVPFALVREFDVYITHLSRCYTHRVRLQAYSSRSPRRSPITQPAPSTVGQGATKDFARGASRRTAGGQENAGVEKQPHLPSRNRCMSASPSAIQAAICSRGNLRGSGFCAPCARSRAARKSINSCFCSGGSASAAASISARLLMGADRSEE